MNLEKNDMGKHIVILQRGWVFIGNLSKQGNQYFLTDANNIRKWGTTKGLGEIALNGPTDKTILDPTPEIQFHELTVIALIKCKK